MKIAFLGDIAFVGKYDIVNNPAVIKRLKPFADKLKKFDYVVGNLEAPFTSKTRSNTPKSIHLRASNESIKLLKILNIDAVSLANNHITDFGLRGLQESIKLLDLYGIDWFGANSKSLLKEIDGERISLSGFCCYSTNGTRYIDGLIKTGINPLTFPAINTQLEKDRQNQAFSILSFHWNTEHTNFPDYENTLIGKKLSKIKDVIVHGHHSHIVQGIQKPNNSLIAHSLGNFLFDDLSSINGRFKLKQNSENKKSFIWEVELKNNKITNFATHGFKETEDGFVYFDINDDLTALSEAIENIVDVESYNSKREQQFKNTILQKFGKRDLAWLVSRLNYYSIGAKLFSYSKRQKHRRAVSSFFS